MKSNRIIWMISLAVLLAGASCSRYTVYSVRTRPAHAVSGGMLYALPTTSVRVAVTFDRLDLSEAPFAEFAKDMLGINPIAKDSLYSIRSVEISSVNKADPDEYFYVVPRRTRVEVDSRGLLLSIGKPSGDKGLNLVLDNNVAGSLAATEAAPVVPEYNLYDRADTFYTRHDVPGKPSLVTTSKDVRSIRQQAQAAAEHIEDIREKKEALIFGEYGGNYSTDAIKYLYDQLEQMEQLYLRQFTGAVQTETVVFYVDPKDEKTLVEDQTVELFRFNPAVGLADSSDKGALIVYCNIRCENELRNAARFVKYRTKSIGSGNYLDRHSFKYRIPETATVTVFSDNFSFVKRVKVSQFGSTANLPYGSCNARFNPVTNELIQYEP